VAVSDITLILERAEKGDPKAAEDLLPLVYDELRRLAACKMAQEKPGQTLQPTALVHEAWIRLAGQHNQHYQNRHCFFGAAAEVMRRILVDRARRRQAARHGGGLERVELDAIEIPNADDALIQDVHEALGELAKLDAEKAEIVKLRFFVGLSFEEIAALLGVNERTVRRRWAFAKAWMCKELGIEEKRASSTLSDDAGSG
jgi:RNA polymerase sigma factor (TIGR02999 family)